VKSEKRLTVMNIGFQGAFFRYRLTFTAAVHLRGMPVHEVRLEVRDMHRNCACTAVAWQRWLCAQHQHAAQS